MTSEELLKAWVHWALKNPIDDEGIQLVVDMEWPQEKKKKKPKSKKDFDFTKYDA